MHTPAKRRQSIDDYVGRTAAPGNKAHEKRLGDGHGDSACSGPPSECYDAARADAVPYAIRPPLLSPAPVSGGMRWRRPYHDIFDLCLLDKGLTPHDPDRPMPTEPAPSAVEKAVGPRIVSVPPAEARVGSEYIYQARACDSYVDGFTWYLETRVAGMAVERHTGKLSWTPAAGGYVEIELCARSVHGPVARQHWTVCVRKATPICHFTANRRFQQALCHRTVRRTPPLLFSWRHAGRRNAAPGFRATAPPPVLSRVAVPLRL